MTSRSTKQSGKRILVVDDEQRVINFIRMHLELDGHQVIEAHNRIEALEAVRTRLPDIILLEVKMPELDGFETLRMLREFSSIPVIILTTKGEENDKVYGLELGADDYISKPFGPRELSSRLKAVLRRSDMPASRPNETVIRIDNRLSVDFNRREVIVNGERVKLRPTEYRLLYHLIENKGWTVSHDQLLAKVWGYEYRDEAHYVRLYVNYLREKIEEDPSHPRYILTEHESGYRFVDFRRSLENEHSDKIIKRVTWDTARFEKNSAVVLHIQGATTPITFTPTEQTLLGRFDKSSPVQPDLDLTPFGALDKGVSRVHVSVYRNQDTLMLMDKGSANGTHLNGEKLIAHQPRVLRDGDEIRLGKLIAHIYFKASISI